MDLHLQVGYGMMKHCQALITNWGGGSAILSPRDLEADQLISFANSLHKLPNPSILLDPQLYLPRANHGRLTSHLYWPTDYDTGLFFQGTGLQQLLNHLRDLNNQLSTREFILPGLFATLIDDHWLESQRLIIETSRLLGTQQPLMVTIALSADVVRDEAQIMTLLEEAERWHADSFYVICESINSAYFVDNPSWLANVLDLVAGLRLSGARVVVGYSNQQMLILNTVKATAIASGTFTNVRSFLQEKFGMGSQSETKQRSTWYYCPQTLSEYTLPYLDIARRHGILDLMAPLPDLDSGQATVLFSGSTPSSSGFSETLAFRHYLSSLKKQMQVLKTDTFDTAIDSYNQMLDRAESLEASLSKFSIRSQPRNFSKVINCHRAALGVLVSTRGPMLRRKWNNF